MGGDGRPEAEHLGNHKTLSIADLMCHKPFSRRGPVARSSGDGWWVQRGVFALRECHMPGKMAVAQGSTYKKPRVPRRGLKLAMSVGNTGEPWGAATPQPPPLSGDDVTPLLESQSTNTRPSAQPVRSPLSIVTSGHSTNVQTLGEFAFEHI